MRKIRVVHLVPGIAIGDQSGGAELYAVQVLRLLDKNEFDRAIFIMAGFQSAAEDTWRCTLTQEDVVVHGFIQIKRPLLRYFNDIFRDLWVFIDNYKPDILHSHTERGDVLNSLIRLFHPRHPKSIRTVHIDKQWVTHPTLGYVFNHLIFPFTLNVEAAVSETILRQLNHRQLAALLNKQARLCHNGIDASYFALPPSHSTATQTPPGLPSGSPRIGIIGRLTEQKGHADLLHAFKEIYASHHAHLLVIGSGPLDEHLKRLAMELNLGNYVHFLGNRDDINAILPHLDLLVSASLWEGFPTVLLEAMSQEVPVIATDVSGSRELIQNRETGLLVPPSSPRRLSAAIDYMLTHSAEARQMGKRARRYASRFTIQNTAACYANLYHQLMEG